MQNQDREQFIVEEINGFKVVRDDLFPGGTKRRAFKRLINSISESELVYAVDYYGHAAYAIALTAQEVGKKVKLFYLSPKEETDIFIKAVSLPNVTYEIVEGAKTQIDASEKAIEYANQSGSKFLPIGLDFQEFGEKLAEVVKEADITAPEIWVMGWSGALGRALQKAYPNIPVNIVSVGTKNFNGGTNKVYDAPENLHEEALVKPPYPSSLHYDAKTWRFILKHAKPGAYIWNVA